MFVHLLILVRSVVIHLLVLEQLAAININKWVFGTVQKGFDLRAATSPSKLVIIYKEAI